MRIGPAGAAPGARTAAQRHGHCHPVIANFTKLNINQVK